MSVAPAVLQPTLGARLAGRSAVVGAVDVDTAGKTDLPIDDDDLAVVAVLQLPDLRRFDRTQRPKLADFDVLLPQLVEELAGCLAAAEAVVQQTHLEAFLALLREQIGEPLADVARSVDEGLDM